jgi:hypothetical protein
MAFSVADFVADFPKSPKIGNEIGNEKSLFWAFYRRIAVS